MRQQKSVSRHFQEFHFPGFTMVVTFTRTGTIMSSGFGPNPAISLSSFITTREPDMKIRILFSPKKCLLSISYWLPFLCAPLDWLLLGEVSKHTPACSLLLFVHHKEKWRKRLDRERTEQSISAVITLKAADISCCRISWSAGTWTRQSFPHGVNLSFIKRERGFMQLKGIKRLKCYLFATQPNRTLFYLGQ